MDTDRIQRIMIALWATWNLLPGMTFGKLIAVIASANEVRDLSAVDDDSMEEYIHLINQELVDIYQQEMAQETENGNA